MMVFHNPNYFTHKTLRVAVINRLLLGVGAEQFIDPPRLSWKLRAVH